MLTALKVSIILASKENFSVPLLAWAVAAGRGDSYPVSFTSAKVLNGHTLIPRSYYSFIYCSSPNSPRHYLPLHSRFSRDYTWQLVSRDLLQMKFTAIRSLFARY